MIPNDYIAMKIWKQHEMQLRRSTRIAMLTKSAYNRIRRAKRPLLFSLRAFLRSFR